MPKTYDEKRKAFDRMLGTRLPKAVKAIELLANLSRKSDYAWTGTELKQMLDQLDDAVDMVASEFGVRGTPEPTPEETGHGPARTLEELQAMPAKKLEPGDVIRWGPGERSEVRWAYDCLRRGDKKTAEARLKLVLENWTKEERE